MAGAREAPRVVAPRVNLALPFSKIAVEDPGREVAELAAVVAEMAVVMERAVAGPGMTELRQRAEAVASRLR